MAVDKTGYKEKNVHFGGKTVGKKQLFTPTPDNKVKKYNLEKLQKPRTETTTAHKITAVVVVTIISQSFICWFPNYFYSAEATMWTI